jgi:hypothetical protein
VLHEPAVEDLADLVRLERQREALDKAKPDPAKVEEYANVLALGWRRRLGIETGEP